MTISEDFFVFGVTVVISKSAFVNISVVALEDVVVVTVVVTKNVEGVERVKVEIDVVVKVVGIVDVVFIK